MGKANRKFMLRIMRLKFVWVLATIGICSMVLAGCETKHPATPVVSINPITVSPGEEVSLPEPQVIRHTQTSPPAPKESLTPAPSPTIRVSLTPDPYELWTIDHLMSREYGGGEIKIVSEYADNSYFTRYLIEYPSDGLTIAGFMNVPKGDGPFPVIIAIHGYIEPEIYSTLDYTTHYADDLARNGFIVIHPNLRNYPPSSSGENLFRVGMAIDILNLIEVVEQKADSGGYLNLADTGSIGLWGHSMGGGISTRVMTINQDIKAVFLYASMSGDEKQNYEAINRWSNGERGSDELTIPESELPRISPEYFFDQVRAAISIHHGLSDELVPVEWSRKTCDLLTQLEKEVECVFYSDMPHTFYGDADRRLMDAAISFFHQQFTNPPYP